MKVTVDTNILVRAVVQDDEDQSKAALELLRTADVIAVPTPCLCEFVWVLRRAYGVGRDGAASAIEALLSTPNVAADRPAIEAGLAVLRAGGDFADGVIAYEGAWLGGEVFLSFDKKAVSLVQASGQQARVLA